MAKKKKENGLVFKTKNAAEVYGAKKHYVDVIDFSSHYMSFLDKSKTERLCIKEIEKQLKDAGYVNLDDIFYGGFSLENHHNFYKIYNKKSLFAMQFNNWKELTFNMVAAHVDAPRLDLKLKPIQEEEKMCVLKTHAYGGIKRYQWANVPLTLIGVFFTKDGKEKWIEEHGIMIPDLAIHVADDQLEKVGNKIINGEELKAVIGTIPIKDKGGELEDRIKLYVLEELKKNYSLTEEDIVFGDFELVPMQNAFRSGFDSSMIVGYGHDDRSCAFAALRGFIELERKLGGPIEDAPHVPVVFFHDREEIGSVGESGAWGTILYDFVEEFLHKYGSNYNVSEVLRRSRAINADVTTAVNPNYSDVHDDTNTAYMGHGVAIERFCSGNGKYYSNNSDAEYMVTIRKLLDEGKIPWQTGEAGKLTADGVGTCGIYFGKYGMDTVDISIPVLSMHSPLEIISKYDLYAAKEFYKAFFGL